MKIGPLVVLAVLLIPVTESAGSENWDVSLTTSPVEGPDSSVSRGDAVLVTAGRVFVGHHKGMFVHDLETGSRLATFAGSRCCTLALVDGAVLAINGTGAPAALLSYNLATLGEETIGPAPGRFLGVVGERALFEVRTSQDVLELHELNVSTSRVRSIPGVAGRSPLWVVPSAQGFTVLTSDIPTEPSARSKVTRFGPNDEILWEASLDGWYGAIFHAPPNVVVVRRGSIAGLDMETGRIAWTQEAFVSQYGRGVEGRFFALCHGQSDKEDVCSFDSFDGRLLWRTFIGTFLAHTFLVEDETLVVTDTFGCAVRLGATRGEVLGTHCPPFISYGAGSELVEGMLVLAYTHEAADGYDYRLSSLPLLAIDGAVFEDPQAERAGQVRVLALIALPVVVAVAFMWPRRKRWLRRGP